MKLMNRILFAVAFDDVMDQCIEKVVKLAKLFDAEVVPVHIIDYTALSMYAPISIYQQDIKEAREKMDVLCSILKNKNIKTCKPIVKLGDIADTILEQSQEMDVNMIVMGANKKSKIEKFFLGSTAEKVVKKSSVPVLLNHPNDHSHKFKKILCAIDLSPSSEQVVKTAIKLARILDSEIEFLHVDKSGLGLKEVIDGIRVMYLGDDLDEVNRNYKEHINSLTKEVNTYLEQFDKQNLQSTVTVRTGNPESAIVDAALLEKDVLLVMGAHGHSGIIHDYIIGSTTDQLLRTTPCSMLTLKGKDLFEVEHEYNQNLILESTALYRKISTGAVPEIIADNYRKGKELMDNGLLKDAIIEFKSCISCCPEFYQAYDHISEAYQRLDEQELSDSYSEMSQAHKRYVYERVALHS